MTRIDMTTRDWHELIKPVLPHVVADKEVPWLHCIRIETATTALYAIATDQHTLAAERHVLRERNYDDTPPVHILAPEAAATLKMLPYAKDDNPELTVTIDKAPIPAGHGHSVMSYAVTLHRPDDGTRLVLRDRRDPTLITTLDTWRKNLYTAMTRPRGRALDGLDLRAPMLARWKDAARGTERLRLHTGPKAGDPLLIVVERHFAGLMTVPNYLDSPAAELADLPWLAELTLIAADLETGEKHGDD